MMQDFIELWLAHPDGGMNWSSSLSGRENMEDIYPIDTTCVDLCSPVGLAIEFIKRGGVPKHASFGSAPRIILLGDVKVGDTKLFSFVSHS